MLVGLWVTTACNLQCTYCYEGVCKPKEYMSVEVADKAIDFILNKVEELNDDLLVVQFHGGEPLLNEKIIKHVVGRLKSCLENTKTKTMFGITTNGLLLNKSNSLFYQANMDYDFSISIDGTKENHDKCRKTAIGRGTYDKLIFNINNYIDIGQDNIRARMTFNSDTVEHLAENVQHIADLGFKVIVSIPDYFDEGWNDEKMSKYYEEVLKIHRWNEKRKKKNLYISLLDKKLREKGICGGGINNFHILPTGEIYPCSYGVGNEEFKLGNLFDGIPLDKNKVQKLQQISKQENRECEDCTNKKYCISTRCKIINKLTMGDYFSPNPVICNIENIKYQYLDFCNI